MSSNTLLIKTAEAVLSERLPIMIDNIDTPEGIANAFKKDFKRLLTKFPNTATEISMKSRLLDNLCSKEQFVLFTTDEVRSACSQLRANKWNDERKINSSAMKGVPDILLQHLACFFSAVSLTGYIPQDLKVNTIFPLLKQTKLDSSLKINYRAIALSNQFSRLLDNLILPHTTECLETSSDMQFAFKSGSSYNKCTYIVKEIK